MELPDRRITATDRKRLKDCIARWEQHGAIPEYGPDAGLNALLDTAEIILDSSEVPSDMVTMNSRVCLRDNGTNAEVVCTLAYPDESAPLKGRISIFSAEGCTLLGARVGDSLLWPTAQGPRPHRLVQLLYQPELAGDLDM